MFPVHHIRMKLAIYSSKQNRFLTVNRLISILTTLLCIPITNRASEIDYSNIFNENTIESKSCHLLTSTWINFARYGHPLIGNSKSILLHPISAEKLSFINFTNSGPILATNPFSNRIQFWNKLYRKYFHF